MSHRQPAQARNAPVIQTGRNCTCGASENASAARVQGKLASSDPSVPVRLTIHVAPIEYGERLQAGVAMRLAVRRRELGARYAHAVVTVCPVCVDYPTRHHRQSLFEILCIDVIKIEPLAARVRACKLFREELAATCVGFPRDVTWRVAVLKSPQSCKIFLSPRIMLPVAMCRLRLWRLRRFGRGPWLDETLQVHV